MIQTKPGSRALAFTLTELLVTVAIIGLLCGLLFTAISKGKSKARSATCLNNLRQHGIALNNFVEQHDCFPLAINPGFFQGKNVNHVTSWKGALRVSGFGADESQAFKEDTSSVWICPSAAKPSNWPENRGYPSYGYNGYGTGSQSNSWGLGGVSAGKELQPVTPAQVTAPSSMYALGDGYVSGQEGIADGLLAIGRRTSIELIPGARERVAKRHAGKGNVVFVDGHVESISLERMFLDASPAAISSWNRDALPH